MTTLEILRAHTARWPEMLPQDGLKLLYQHSFGGGHLIRDPREAQQRLEQEYEATQPDDRLPLFEPLGGGWARLHLAAAKSAGVSAALVGKMFLASARPTPEDRTLQGVDELRALVRQGACPAFDAAALEECLAGYTGEPVSHTGRYREAYHPAYRVVDARLEALLPLLLRVEAERPHRVAIEGRAASGKTTAAEFLAAMYGYEVVHMDDFFLPFDMRSAARLAEPGGNVHYERFKEEVLPGLAGQAKFSYGVFDCSQGKLSGRKEIDGAKPVLVEGAYCLRPDFDRPYDLTAFYDIDPQEQKKRILLRNGPRMAERFEKLWVPLENRYHEHCRTAQRADVLLRETEQT